MLEQLDIQIHEKGPWHKPSSYWKDELKVAHLSKYKVWDKSLWPGVMSSYATAKAWFRKQKNWQVALYQNQKLSP